MGSNSSKSGNAVSQSSSSSSRVRKTRSRGNSVFQSSCLRSTDIDDSDDQQSKEFGGYGPRSNGADQESNLVKTEGYSKVEQTEEMPGVTSDAELDERGHDSIINTISRANSSSSGGFLSRSGFFSGNVSCRLSRTTSDGSSRRAHPLSSTNFSVSSNEELYQNKGAINGNLCVNSQASASSNNFRDVTTIPTQGMVRENSNARVRYDASSHSPRNHTAFEGTETRLAARPIGAREPAERNVRFSRTLSVGRLRDRVLHRTSLPILSSYPSQQEREDGVGRHSGGRQAWNVETGESVFNGNTLSTSTSSSYAPSSMSSSLYNGRDYETTRSREESYHDLLEHRSHFLERRRRIRSQLRALQRLGGRFGNLSGHERSCVLCRQTGGVGRCSCCVSAQGANPNDDASARSSISRIVVLAEALFEVLDEIHQQSVVLSSRASVSAIGSVPAPIEVVESLPLKSYAKVPKHLTEDAAQCYICLVEYEEGDSMRMLPCHHEFHRICIDKWLKEIHRVCPLCRGDICRSDSFSMRK